MFLYHDTIHDLWTSLTHMYVHKQNDSNFFASSGDCSCLPGNLESLVANCFSYLQSRWEELAQYEPLSEFLIETASLVAKRLNRQHTYQILMGLKAEFESLRTQILKSSPMPVLYEVFATIDSDEHR